MLASTPPVRSQCVVSRRKQKVGKKKISNSSTQEKMCVKNMYAPYYCLLVRIRTVHLHIIRLILPTNWRFSFSWSERSLCFGARGSIFCSCCHIEGWCSVVTTMKSYVAKSLLQFKPTVPGAPVRSQELSRWSMAWNLFRTKEEGLEGMGELGPWKDFSLLRIEPRNIMFF